MNQGLGCGSSGQKVFMATVQSAGLMFSGALFSGFSLILRQGKAAAVPSLAEEILAGGWDALASFDPRTW
jgi:hypothetical protein